MIDALAADRARIVDFDAQIHDLEHTLAVLHTSTIQDLEHTRAHSESCHVAKSKSARSRATRFLQVSCLDVAERNCRRNLHLLPSGLLSHPCCPPLAGSRPPILLTHNCAGWRKIALAFSALWRAMEISCSDPAYLASTLGRSGFCPLSICMDGWCSGLDNVGPFIAAVLSHRARWQYLSLCLAAQSDNNHPCIGGSMPLLWHLDLERWLEVALAFIHRGPHIYAQRS
ncbi:hypothetical protein DFH08DRAFT_413719 [Mycena albidolilacea]|uniref:Uncharacterized protein n=1 Tax=Mycena albidolilacea TaxID=1033008 RepID=A0AAD7AII2_9AGAR|nr:hypothetical protein DFH08DRAFT_413719 [Mycena albidolilacea]